MVVVEIWRAGELRTGYHRRLGRRNRRPRNRIEIQPGSVASIVATVCATVPAQAGLIALLTCDAVDRAVANQVVARMRQMDQLTAERMVASIPDAWDVSADGRQALVDFIV